MRSRVYKLAAFTILSLLFAGLNRKSKPTAQRYRPTVDGKTQPLCQKPDFADEVLGYSLPRHIFSHYLHRFPPTIQAIAYFCR
jgi:hypothetical protein